MTVNTQRMQQQVSSHLRLAADLLEGRSGFEGASFEDRYHAKQLEVYNLLRGLSGVVDPVHEPATVEKAVASRAHADKEHQSRGFYIPFSMLARDLVVGTPSAGGNLVGKDTSADAAEWLRPNSFAVAAGATVYTGCQDSFGVPYLTGGATAQVVSENAASPNTQLTLGQVTLQPTTITGYTVISRKLDLQSPKAAEIVANDLSAAVAQVIDNLVLNGTGSGNEPMGLLSHSGVNIVALGANGAAPTWSNLVDMEHLVAQQDADKEPLAYVTSANVRKKLRTTAMLTGGSAPIWTRDSAGASIGGTRAFSTTLVPSNLVKGTSSNCSAIVYGRWSELLIGFWGKGIEVMIDRKSFSTTGAVRLIVMVDVAIGIRRAQTFSVCKDVVTS